MKKCVFICVLLLGISSLQAQAPAQKVEVPDVVKAAFHTEYPDATATWNREGKNYLAEYYDVANDLNRAVLYDKNGKHLRTDTEAGAGTYPLPINDYFLENYPNESYTVWSCSDKKGNTIFYAKRNNLIFWFDTDGTFVKKKQIN